MIQSLKIKFDAPAGVKLTQSVCSLLHGVLMENIDCDYADVLHTPIVRAFILTERAMLYIGN